MRQLKVAMVVWAVAMVISVAPMCWASDQARIFLSALEDYKSGDYASAAARFETIAHSGVRNGQLFYNLGNAYLKNRQLGPAILWYERALELLPGDPDLRFNLNYARSLTKDASEASDSPLVQILFFWNYHLSEQVVVVLAIGFNLLFWLLLALFRLTRRRSAVRAAMGAAAAAMIFGLTAGFNYYETRHPTAAIVLPEETAIRSGFDESSTELFVLHAGAKIKVLKERKGHYQIRFAADKIGWVDKAHVGMIGMW